ncbi:ATPase involved in DNA repair [Pseudanabaena sp. lw0831]|uniref:salt stress protein, Slr1339 family n=1 Tax=Pseudanabaena sp. lw0831 TaxID=1357935 RepID=UPI001915FB7A|nr:hypothetical protein [Pseudanabaena sp. lw0831]GBO54889.1 ATPase involved in DNA repair [Pseudanabaena sp. lw0831]
MESLESILSDLQGKYKDPEISKQGKDDKTTAELTSQGNSLPIALAPNSLDSLLNDLRSNSSSNLQSNSQNYVPDYRSPQVTPEVTPNQTSPVIDRAIDRDMQQIANQQKAKDHEAIAKTASEWLKKLDPLGGEGLWFEEFAKNYPSRLEAAIALLQSK